MKIRVLLSILVVAGIVGSLGRVAEASIVLNYTFNSKGEARLVGVESALAHAIRMSIESGENRFAVRLDNQVAADGSRLPVLRIRPINSAMADTAIAGEAYLTFSFQTDQESGEPVWTWKFDVSNLSGTRFQDLAEVDFRVYFYSSESDEPLEFDGIRLNGEKIVAPEPGSSVVWLVLATAIFCLGAVAWTARRNRAILSYAGTGPLRTPASRRTNQPWPDQAREAILEIIDRGRMN